MKKDLTSRISPREIKTGAGRAALLYWVPFFMVTVLLFVVSIFLAPLLFGKSLGSLPSSSYIFGIYIIAITVAIPGMMYLCGYNSRRMQRMYIASRIKSANHLAKYYLKSIQSFIDQCNVAEQKSTSELRSSVDTAILRADQIKEEIISSAKEKIKIVKDTFVEFEKTVGKEIDVVQLVRLKAMIEENVEDIENHVMESISKLNANKVLCETIFQESTQRMNVNDATVINEFVEFLQKLRQEKIDEAHALLIIARESFHRM